MNVEAVILTGGASRRMGQDKASLLVDGVPLAERIVSSLLRAGVPVTVLGRSPIEGAAFLPDAEDFSGPLSALARFKPSAGTVFLTSCDVPLFDVELVGVLARQLNESEAVTPVIEGYRQPLSALYRASAFDRLPALIAQGKRSMMAWLDSLDVDEIDEAGIVRAGLDPRCLASANTPEELAWLLA